MIVSLIVKMISPISQYLHPHALGTYGYSEFLINFRGGFVRRGLLGEILLYYTQLTGYSPKLLITLVCLAAYIYVAYFFLRKFRKGGYCWWFIFSAVMCGFVTFMIRKDFILYVMEIGIFSLIRNPAPALWRRFLAFLLAAAALLLHEGFIFWGIPVFALVLLTDRRHLYVNLLMIAALLSVFGILCMFKGNSEISRVIIDSWNSLLPDASISCHKMSNSITALSWETKETILMHLRLNTGSSSGGFGLLYWMFMYLLIYYFITFFFNAFRPSYDNFGKKEQTLISSIFLILTVCMLPMFIGFSCDYGRLFQHITITTFAAFFTFDERLMKTMIPNYIQNKTSAINNELARNVVPTKGLLLFLLLIIGVSPARFDVPQSIMESPIGAIYYGFIFIIKHI